jgi:hypothetical protein
MNDIKLKSEIECVNYILTQFEGKLNIKKLYGLMYLIQKDYLSTFGKTVFEDKFILDNYYFIKPFHFHQNRKTYYTLTDEELCLKDKVDFYYIAEMEKKIIDKWCNTCKDWSVEKYQKEMNDFAYKKAKNRFIQDPDLMLITDIDIAKAGGGQPDLIDYIREHKTIEIALGV